MKKCNQATREPTLALEKLSLDHEPAVDQAVRMQPRGRKTVVAVPGGPFNGRAPAQASDRWCSDPDAPIYQPLNIPPVGIIPDRTVQHVSLKDPMRSTADEHTKDDEAKLSTALSIVSSSKLHFTTAVKPLVVPVPDPSYIVQSAMPAIRSSVSQALLLVLDLNGTLLYRSRASSAYKARPSLDAFLAHCVSNYSVLVWSSAKPHNVSAICSQIFTPAQRRLLLGEWGRDTLDLTAAQYLAKVQVYKCLDRIWKTEAFQRAHPYFARGHRWGQWNTLLLDDSVLKSSAQPYNAVVVPEFIRGGDKEESDGAEVLGQVVAYLETARMYNNVSCFARQYPFQVNDCCTWDWASGSPRQARMGSESDSDSGGVRF
ncbi:MAG: hypothetical protein Q9220_007195 [cf. Caloplaca sp. 1 TL-2023]